MDLRKKYEGKKILVTGHTGFKGVWLSLMLSNFGAEIHGLSLFPEEEQNLFLDTDLENAIKSSTYLDIRDSILLKDYLREREFDLIFHLAAQALVSEGYRDPIGTFETNVMGTVNLLVGAADVVGLKGIVCVTTDKVYLNSEEKIRFQETDRLGGKDPYGGSKASSEIAIESLYYLLKDKNMSLVACRSGNVIGGGDWSKNRLIPDAMRAIQSDYELEIRNPKSTRPWQHVLDCLHGYLLVGAKIFETEVSFFDTFNFGPIHSETVNEVITLLKEDHALRFHATDESFGYEYTSLELDSTKAEEILGWHSQYSPHNSVRRTSEWYKAFFNGQDPRLLTQASIERFLDEIN